MSATSLSTEYPPNWPHRIEFCLRCRIAWDPDNDEDEVCDCILKHGQRLVGEYVRA